MVKEVLLTKSRYLAGMQCPKYLWMLVHTPEKVPEADIGTQHRMTQGLDVGRYAHKLFPNGVLIESENFKKNLEKSSELIKERKILFEPGFLAGKVYARADILAPAGTEAWDIIEVKSATAVKEEHIEDVAFQKFVYESAGLKIRACLLMHINNEYVKKGDIDIKQLFKIENITEKVLAITNVRDKIDSMLKVISAKKCPDLLIGGQCRKPSQCPVEVCWEFLPEHHIFELYGKGKAVEELFEKGVYCIKDIPDSYVLNEKQDIQRKTAISGKAHVVPAELKKFISSFKDPVSYLDFETFGAAIPIFDGTMPYQNIPFQFSLHVGKKHFEFLAEGALDPRLKFIEELKKVLPAEGNIVAYNAHFEKNVLKELALSFPMHKEWINSLMNRFIDLLVPFRNFWYYSPKQHGRCSIKDVLPALTGKSYKGMDIAEGGLASLEYVKITYKVEELKLTKKDIEKVRSDLLKYCELDTKAMMMIVEKLKKISEK